MELKYYSILLNTLWKSLQTTSVSPCRRYGYLLRQFYPQPQNCVLSWLRQFYLQPQSCTLSNLQLASYFALWFSLSIKMMYRTGQKDHFEIAKNEAGKKSLKSKKRIISGVEKTWYYAFFCGKIYFIFYWNWVFAQILVILNGRHGIRTHARCYTPTAFPTRPLKPLE